MLYNAMGSNLQSNQTKSSLEIEGLLLKLTETLCAHLRDTALWSVEMTSLLSEATKHVSNLLHQTNFRIPKIPPICNSNQRS